MSTRDRVMPLTVLPLSLTLHCEHGATGRGLSSMFWWLPFISWDEETAASNLNRHNLYKTCINGTVT